MISRYPDARSIDAFQHPFSTPFSNPLSNPFSSPLSSPASGPLSHPFSTPLTFSAPNAQENAIGAQGPDETFRFATYNAALNRESEGVLREDLIAGDDQARQIAEVIQQNRPDVLLINEFDFDPAAAEIFLNDYLAEAQGSAPGIEYPYVFSAPVNTGVASGVDLDGSGEAVTEPGAPGYGNDALGFGQFPGQYGMLVLSRAPIDTEGVRTFSDFLWRDMPGARLPDNPETPAPGDYYSQEALEVLPLSSKSHWDIPIEIGGETVHLLASHPTPPTFDGPEDRNGLRNADEIRLWSDYVTPGQGDYLVDDQGRSGGLGANERFVIAGDLNADPLDGDSLPGAAQQLLGHPLAAAGLAPESEGGVAAAERQGLANEAQEADPRFDTADFNDQAPGNLRVDYLLPSEYGLTRVDGGVYWPAEGEAAQRVEASDHRLVQADLAIDDGQTRVESVDFLGQTAFESGLEFQDTPVGGLSGLVRVPESDTYLAISDDRSSLADARFYSLEIDLEDGALDDGDVHLRDVTTLRRKDCTPWPEGEIDPEGIALTGDGRLFISSEGAADEGIAPFVGTFDQSGQKLENFTLPEAFYPDGEGSFGVRDNLAFESLTLTPDGERLFTATENALAQDGPAADLTTGSPSRILSLDPATGAPLSQYLYPTEPVPQVPAEPDGFSDNGLVELLALDEDHLLALERGYSAGVGNDIRLYEIDLEHATDVSAIESLEASASGVRPVEKTLLTRLNEFDFEPDNVEGMALGPTLDDGRQSLVLTSDDNFNDTQSTQFIALALDIAPDGQPDLDEGTGGSLPDFSLDPFLPAPGMASLMPHSLRPEAIFSSLLDGIMGLPGGEQAFGLSGGDPGTALFEGGAEVAGVSTAEGNWLMPG